MPACFSLKTGEILMALYEIAGLIIDIDFKYDYCINYCADFIYKGSREADFSVSVSEAEIEKMKAKDELKLPNGMYESLCAYKQICDKAFEYDCMFMHCSALSYCGNAVLFTAPSGTGKSTHSRLWREYFGDKVEMINDDKPLLRRIDGKFFVCGTPWNGKHHLGSKKMAPVKSIVILSQAQENSIKKASPGEAIFTVLNQTIRPYDENKMDKLMELVNGLLGGTPVYKMGCNISENAVTTAFSAVKENFDED